MKVDYTRKDVLNNTTAEDFCHATQQFVQEPLDLELETARKGLQFKEPQRSV